MNVKFVNSTSESTLKSVSLPDFIEKHNITNVNDVSLSRENKYPMVNFINEQGQVLGVIFGKKSAALVEVGQRPSKRWNIVEDLTGKLKISVAGGNRGTELAD